MDEKMNNTKKFLPDWFSAIWFFGIFSTLIVNMPYLDKLQWAIGHTPLIFVFTFGTILFLLWIIAIPIFLLTKKYNISKFQSVQIVLSLVVWVVALLLNK